MNIFQKKRFQMHSGGFSDFKLECDALTKEDYKTLAFLVSRKLNFKECYGIPSGGLLFAECLNEYADKNSPYTLIADDVLTTGRSFFNMKEQLIKDHNIEPQNIIGVSVFTRGEAPPFVTSIFTLNQDFWQND